MCPKCGKKDTVLQSVVSDQWECRLELGGCGAVFDSPVPEEAVEQRATVKDAVRAMTDAIREFEQQEYPLGRDALVEMERRTGALMETLKAEIVRLSSMLLEADSEAEEELLWDDSASSSDLE